VKYHDNGLPMVKCQFCHREVDGTDPDDKRACGTCGGCVRHRFPAAGGDLTLRSKNTPSTPVGGAAVSNSQTAADKTDTTGQGTLF